MLGARETEEEVWVMVAGRGHDSLDIIPSHAAQKIQARSFIPLCSRMRDWKPVTTDEVYVVLALFMLMGIIQKPTKRSN
jgi:hypothetical protein